MGDARNASPPVRGWLVIIGWHGSSVQPVVIERVTPKRFGILAVVRTRLAGRGRWLEPGQRTLVPLSAVRVVSDCESWDGIVRHAGGSVPESVRPPSLERLREAFADG